MAEGELPVELLQAVMGGRISESREELKEELKTDKILKEIDGYSIACRLKSRAGEDVYQTRAFCLPSISRFAAETILPQHLVTEESASCKMWAGGEDHERDLGDVSATPQSVRLLLRGYNTRLEDGLGVRHSQAGNPHTLGLCADQNKAIHDGPILTGGMYCGCDPCILFDFSNCR
ncbi:hypothetical protein AB1Y20_012940 [Prymnesium parvum]|uniref:Poly [ADP-ribose] polymerase n=1 Tax=Prymnesium parvum TaxID=97485 RepID=A0AB34IK92_PRYPA